MQFNLCMEPWLKYAMHLVADQGLQRSQWTSGRLLREVLYVETNRCFRCPMKDLLSRLEYGAPSLTLIALWRETNGCCPAAPQI